MEDLLLEVKNEVIEALNLEDMTPEDLGDDDPLFGAGGLGAPGEEIRHQTAGSQRRQEGV